MGFKKFSLLIALRTTLLIGCISILVLLFNTPGYHAATLLVIGVLAVLLTEFFRFVSKTNKELTRFLDAARYADFSQRFKLSGMGAGFGELGEAFTDILDRFQEVRADQERELRRLKALIEHVPVPLISVHQDGLITLWNNAARRLFGSAKITRLSNLSQFGEEFLREITTIPPGERRLALFENDGVEEKLSLAATQIIFGGKSEKLISLQDIQSELDVVQLQAWQDLVRVLTHEIMNSITPVASLATTSVDLVEDVKTKVADNPELVEELQDVSDAVTTVARRSDGLMSFVSSYRRLTRLPPPQKETILLGELVKQAQVLGTQQWEDKELMINISIEPTELDVSVDANMIEQILINMIQNAEQALIGTHNPTIWIKGFLSKRGRPVLEISDNGPGIADEIIKKIFVPFFTTKRDGSGVGLALTRQVMIAHGGNVKVTNLEQGGACFTLTF
ncbi:ATP-binding protein [Temperatibacter marinus]|uniref:histidine kinase n=1 Tax=Temperatibacter marinus TaxID=1456591 RepID=A0AA52H9G3_9PROT|nr:ATP-binding protein [Temperatibacter marinus]WND01655.1 ATP-binding protein [Temperatibacter marinus]